MQKEIVACLDKLSTKSMRLWDVESSKEGQILVAK